METPHVLLDGSINSDTKAGAPVKGDLIVGVDQGAGAIKWQRVPRGTQGQILRPDAGGVLAWESLKGYYTLLAAVSVAWNPNDSANYYAGKPSDATNPTNDARQGVPIPKAGTVEAVYTLIEVSGTLGSNESTTGYLRLNASVDNLLSNAYKFTAVSNNLDVTGLAIAVAAGDRFTIKFATPAWVTNPTTVRIICEVLISYPL